MFILRIIGVLSVDFTDETQIITKEKGKVE